MDYSVYMSHPAATFETDERIFEVLMSATLDQTRLQLVPVAGGKRALVKISEIVAIVPKTASRMTLPEPTPGAATFAKTALPDTAIAMLSGAPILPATSNAGSKPTR